jgi:hypothetical protein
MRGPVHPPLRSAQGESVNLADLYAISEDRPIPIILAGVGEQVFALASSVPLWGVGRAGEKLWCERGGNDKTW